MREKFSWILGGGGAAICGELLSKKATTQCCYYKGEVVLRELPTAELWVPELLGAQVGWWVVASRRWAASWGFSSWCRCFCRVCSCKWWRHKERGRLLWIMRVSRPCIRRLHVSILLCCWTELISDLRSFPYPMAFVAPIQMTRQAWLPLNFKILDIIC